MYNLHPDKVHAVRRVVRRRSQQQQAKGTAAMSLVEELARRLHQEQSALTEGSVAPASERWLKALPEVPHGG